MAQKRGIGLQGIYFHNQGSKLLGRLFVAAGDEPAPTAVILHGVPGIEQNHDLAHALREAGFNAVIFHYRGSWGSEGDYSLAGVPSDVTACLDHLCDAQHAEVVDRERLYLVGHSLGGWAAVMAGDDPRVKGVAAIAAVVDPPPIPFDEAAAEAGMVPWLHGVTPADFARQWAETPASIEAAGRLGKPLLVLHAEDDDVIPVAQAHLLYDAATEPKDLALHPGAGHAFIGHRGWLIEQVVGWLRSLEKGI